MINFAVVTFWWSIDLILWWWGIDCENIFFFLGMEIFWLYVLVYEIDELNFYVAEPQGVSKC